MFRRPVLDLSNHRYLIAVGHIEVHQPGTALPHGRQPGAADADTAAEI